MKRKKVGVMHVQIPFNRGGAELMVENLTFQLQKRGFNAELITMPYKWYPEYTLYDSMMLWRFFENKNIDLVIPTKFPSYGIKHPNKVAWIIHQFRQVYDLYDSPYGYKEHINGETIRKNVIRYDEIALSECKEIYGISQTVSDRVNNYNGFKCKTLYHPPSLAGRYFHEEYGEYIVSVGRLDKLKRNEMLIKSLKYCNSKIKALIAGRGAEFENLQELAVDCGVSDRVKFLGFVSDDELLKLYAGAFAVYYAPMDEDYGYITLEAFLSKKPLITCGDSGGVLEFAKNGINCFVCEKDPEDIGHKIDCLYFSKSKCKEFGNAGYETVKDISWDIVIDSLTESIR